MKFLVWYILLTLSFSVYKTLCLRTECGSPWIRQCPYMAFQLGAFALALLLYHRDRAQHTLLKFSKFRCHCGKFGFMRRRRMNTAYVEDEKNWTRCCDDCFEEICDHYTDMWKSIY